MANTYGVALTTLTKNGEYRDVSNSARGAKNYATRNGYKIVYVRFNGSCNIAPIAYRNGKKWTSTPNLIEA